MKRTARPLKFILRQLNRGCWIVGCQGRWIGGAVLSSLPAAAAYAMEIARGLGGQKVVLAVAPQPH